MASSRSTMRSLSSTLALSILLFSTTTLADDSKTSLTAPLIIAIVVIVFLFTMATALFFLRKRRHRKMLEMQDLEARNAADHEKTMREVVKRLTMTPEQRLAALQAFKAAQANGGREGHLGPLEEHPEPIPNVPEEFLMLSEEKRARPYSNTVRLEEDLHERILTPAMPSARYFSPQPSQEAIGTAHSRAYSPAHHDQDIELDNRSSYATERRDHVSSPAHSAFRAARQNQRDRSTSRERPVNSRRTSDRDRSTSRERYRDRSTSRERIQTPRHHQRRERERDRADSRERIATPKSATYGGRSRREDRERERERDFPDHQFDFEVRQPERVHTPRSATYRRPSDPSRENSREREREQERRTPRLRAVESGERMSPSQKSFRSTRRERVREREEEEEYGMPSTARSARYAEGRTPRERQREFHRGYTYEYEEGNRI